MNSDPKRSSSAEKLTSDGSTPDGNESTWIVGEDQANDQVERSESFEVQGGDSPSLIGRYQVVSQLGRGGFGYVYKAWDPELKCEVAVKVPRWDRVLRPGEMDRFREEARTLARIRNHPSIVTVYDIAETQNGIPFAVMEFVEGQTLSDYIKQDKLSVDDALQILLQIAEALKAAHQLSIIHRDLKPSNVILDREGNVTLVDFGLALHDDLTYEDLGNAVEGTAPYMAPEQIRGENHRIDGQTDIWAFGVMMYRLLTGKHPFRAKETKDLARMIRYREAKPPRQLNPQIPKEIERICLKCLSKMMRDRYQSVPDLIDELTDAVMEMRAPPEPIISDSDLAHLKSHGLIADSDPSGSQRDSGRSARSARSGRSTGSGFSEPSQSHSLSVTYKGLRPFDSNDKDFFLELLPGQRTRDGVPESIQFWKGRIKGDELEPLTVGLIYGPSGCGKSSFVRAGLLPLLPTQVNPVYLECTAEQSEKRLARQIAHRIHSVNPEDPLPEILRQFRRGDHLASEDKLLIVLDQFEQWLHGNHDFENPELIEALRQCDGETVSCMLLIRDDFWMSTSEVMKSLEIPIREGHNALALPLFDERHARKVLVAYGRAFDRLPRSTDLQGSSLNNQQKKFVKEAVKSLSQNGKVICVHLSVFAQIVKDREWTATELHRMGGLKGVGVRFLDDLFHSRDDTKFHREQEEIVKSVFHALLPPIDTSIKGSSRTRDELRDLQNGKFQQSAVDGIVERLESDLRLISLVDDAATEEIEFAESSEYRLTHDFLVSPIREWLVRKEKETWRGRSRIRMNELAERWSDEQSRRFLPSPLEYLQIVFGVKSSEIDNNANSMLQASHRFYAGWLTAASLMVVAISALIWMANNRSSQRVAEATYESLLDASDAAIIPYAEKISEQRNQIARLVKNHDLSNASSEMKFRRALIGLMCDPDVQEYSRTILGHLEFMSDDDLKTLQMIVSGSSRKDRWIQRYHELFEKSESITVRMRIAVLLSTMNDDQRLSQILAIDDDQTDRTLLICQLPEMLYDQQLPLTILQRNNEAIVQSAMLGVIRQQNESIYSQRIDELDELCVGLLHEHPNKSVHGFAKALATRHGFTSKIGKSLLNAEWKLLTDYDLTFLKIPAGTQVEVSRRSNEGFGVRVVKGEHRVAQFWICDQEVTINMFLDFLNDEAYDVERSDIDEYPQLTAAKDPQRALFQIKTIDALKFCNWLSESLEKQPFYVEQEDKSWTHDTSADGFRLPTWPELEFATRSGGDTILHIGDASTDEVILTFENKLITGVGAPDWATEPACQRLPNHWGLFDSLGNIDELCTDPAASDTFFSRGNALDCFVCDKLPVRSIPGTEQFPVNVGLRLVLNQPSNSSTTISAGE